MELDPDGQPRPGINKALRMRRSIDELLGVCKGIIFDGIVTETEVTGLAEYLNHHQEIATEWPGDVIVRRLKQILADGIVDDDEREDLRQLPEQVTGSNAETAALEDRASTLPLDDPAPIIVIPDREFCFTGRFYFGTRKRCQRAVADLGGVAHSSVRRSTDYFVIGLLGSRDWVHSTHGTKIQRAMELRERELSCAIVSEEHWATFV